MIARETQGSPCQIVNNFTCMNATLKDSIHSLRNVIRVTLYSAQTWLKTAPQGNYYSVAFIQIMSNKWIVSLDCFRDSDLFSFICYKKIELPSLGKCLNFRKISLEGKICRRVCKKGSDSIFGKLSANKKFKA